MNKNILIVKHLPKLFTKELCLDFLKNFGACNVRFMGNTGRMKHCAFAEFKNEIDAKGALNKLHQFSFLNTTLVVEFSKNLPRNLEDPHVKDTFPEESIEIKNKNLLEKERNKLKNKVHTDINSVSTNLNFDYSINPNLYYSYPKPTMSILMNIVNALASVPKLYVQVLHLMNKMNLPAPFGRVTLTSDIEDDLRSMQEVSDESEYDSSTENNSKNLISTKKRKRPKLVIDELTRKKMKLQMMMEAQLPMLLTSMTNTVQEKIENVFENVVTSDKLKKIDIKINTDIDKTNTITTSSNLESETVENTGFGKIIPESKNIEKPNIEIDHEWKKEDFITDTELNSKKLPQNEYKNVNAFKNYNPGDLSSRLYIKNLSKTISERDLHWVFGRFVDWDNEDEVVMYDIRLMKEGRMKGQAFVSLPSERHARQALTQVNGYLLQGKPVAIHFARSAKIKMN